VLIKLLDRIALHSIDAATARHGAAWFVRLLVTTVIPAKKLNDRNAVWEWTRVGPRNRYSIGSRSPRGGIFFENMCRLTAIKSIERTVWNVVCFITKVCVAAAMLFVATICLAT